MFCRGNHKKYCYLILISFIFLSLFKAHAHEQKQNNFSIDYLHLDKKYYKFIKKNGKFYDEDIQTIIHKVDEGEKKNTFFVGISTGINMNFGLSFMSGPIFGADTTKIVSNYTMLNLRAGYQNYTSQVFPINTFGYQIYLDIMSSFGSNALFFSGLNADFLYDFLNIDDTFFTLNLGVGFGGANITGLQTLYDNSFEIAYKINLGIGVRFLQHHRIIYITNAIQGLQRGFIGITFMIGYDYVF
ncbi:hypothetical protein CQA53_03810 [Helicobacter didelphidarum]|uniref:Outer membrane beta-barrel protein n=1 Tax=Helicobacter didelphidarum TaxID=2040648 RepID=A0A3D8IN84_9HELI|nr:hypothetical protein [Helicobacter didelphidarum]RDU66356.1 hypothetical protein CQA53_03810 [Helicobacter didelphidarum]